MSALQFLRGGFGRTLCSLAAAAAMAITAPSLAQFGLSGGIADAFRPAYTTRDVQLAVDMLQLDDAQKFILETLFDDYEAEFETGVNAFKNRISGLRETLAPTDNPDPGQIMRVVFGTINEWREESRQLADQFTIDLKDLLNDEQTAAWPAFERKLFRLKFLKNGQLPGETLDLLNDVRDLELDPALNEKLQPTLLEYELALDKALRLREDYMQRSQTELIDAIQVQDYESSVTVAERQVEYRKGVRDVNEMYTATIAAALPEESAATFIRRINERTYPRVYRKTPAERAFEAALEIEGLDTEVVSAINELQVAYLAELAGINEQLKNVVRDFKPRELTHKVEQAANRLRGNEVAQLNDPLRERYADRREIGNRYMEQLRALLSPDQFANLPGARRWLSPDERAAAEAQQRSAGKQFVVPTENAVGRSVPNALKDAAGASDQKDDDGSDNPDQR